jgi:preprotein translocase subunit SecE
MGPQGSRAIAMAKENGGPSGWMQLLQELFKTDVYKRSQGRMVRQFTCLAIWVAFGLAAYRMFELRGFVFGRVFDRFISDANAAATMSMAVGFVVPAFVLAVGLWIGYRIVNLPTFADFLIAVEAEMNKVSWPSRTELIRASMVVIVLMFGLMIVLFGYDLVLNWLLSKVLRVTIV